MEDYTFDSIKGTLSKIGGSQGRLLLPAIQRHFVWGPDRICKLFDSILSGYPISTFMFWEVPDETRNDYAFYEFIKHFTEFGNESNAPASRNLPKGVIGVLDGQQRLNSMYVALCGRYEQFSGAWGKWRSVRSNYEEKEFYLNLLAQPDDDDSWKFEFKFLSASGVVARNERPGELWFSVGTALHWESEQEAADFLHQSGLNKPLDSDQGERALGCLQVLFRALNKENLIAAYRVRDKELPEALEIFLRANRGGIQLQAIDLYFSTIAAYWREGRDEVERFLHVLNTSNTSEKRFDFEISSLVLACLTLTDGPIQLNIESFGSGHVEKIRENWPNIQANLLEAIRLLDAWGFSGNNHISIHASLPIALAHRAGYDMAGSAEDLRKFVIRTLVADFYARGTSRRNRVLSEIRKFMAADVKEYRIFSLERALSGLHLPPGISFHVTEETIEELLETQIRKPKAFLLLSLLHGQHALHQTYFDKDHIHPSNGFNDLAAINVPPQDHHHWHVLRDQLPNLQLLQGRDNRSKQDKKFEEWLESFRPDQQQRTRYLDENDIPVDASLDFADFLTLFEKRKDLLRKKLVSILGSKVSSQVNTESEMVTTVP
jgi:hypothetical protein